MCYRNTPSMGPVGSLRYGTGGRISPCLIRINPRKPTICFREMCAAASGQNRAVADPKSLPRGGHSRLAVISFDRLLCS